MRTGGGVADDTYHSKNAARPGLCGWPGAEVLANPIQVGRVFSALLPNLSKRMLYDENVVNDIKDILTQKRLTVAVAESVTAGHLQAALSSAIEASRFFQGGLTAYNLGQKCRHLQVDPILAEGCDCVDEVVARTMAREACSLFASHYSIAITGYAAKMPEKGLNDLFAWYAIAFNKEVVLCEKISTTKERVDAQVDYTRQVLQKFLTLLREGAATAVHEGPGWTARPL